jgi:lysophospholipase L1-like esterase
MAPVAGLVAALVLLAGAAAPAHALELRADASERGYIGFQAQGPPGKTATVSEQVGSQLVPVASIPLGGGTGTLPRALRWRCDRLTRRFVASAPATLGGTETASAELTTRSCRNRLGIALKRRRVRAGRRIALRLRDRFGVGELGVRICTRAPGGRRRCGRATMPAGTTRVSRSLRASRPGRWLVDARVKGGRRLRRVVRVRPRRGRLRVLATGDSMIQIVDSYLKQRLRARVRSDARISTGISKPAMFDWVRHARRQAAARPDVTVVFIGANDGFPIGGVDCCGEAWINAYARRVRRMMAAYKRGRAGIVYWLTLPTPRDANFARVFGPVNKALRRAAAGFREQVRLIDLRRTFTPGGRFQRVIRYRGRDVVARQGDGVHLSTAGASIAASLIIRALRRDRIL